jgi:hypothetical protein
MYHLQRSHFSSQNYDARDRELQPRQSKHGDCTARDFLESCHEMGEAAAAIWTRLSGHRRSVLPHLLRFSLLSHLAFSFHVEIFLSDHGLYAGCWFLLDVVFYANGLFSAILVGLFGIGEHAATSREKVRFSYFFRPGLRVVLGRLIRPLSSLTKAPSLFISR